MFYPILKRSYHMQAPIQAPANGLIMHYPSVPSAYYATGQWLEAKGERLVRNLYAARFTHTNGVIDFPNGHKGHKEKIVSIFDANMSYNVDDNPRPSVTTGMYWIQAPIPQHAVERLTKITVNSGKFLVFVPNKFDETWAKFRDAYLTGALECYGLRCSTAKPNPNAGNNGDIITVHVGNAFDLDDVAKVAKQIDKVLGSWSGVLNFMTDRSTMKRCNKLVSREHRMLYSISSRTFIKDAIYGGVDKRTLPEFTETFKFKFAAAAQNLQYALEGKRTSKFAPPRAISP